jgi:hypothetical protein
MYTGPHIVTDGLVQAIDAASARSYPGSGTAWNDLSEKANNTTLENGPVYSSDKQGVFEMDGTDDYVDAAASQSVYNITRYISVFATVKCNNLSGFNGIFGQFSGGNGMVHFQTSGNVFGVYVYGPNLGVTSTATLTSNVWMNLGFTFDGTTCNLFINGLKVTSGTTGSTANLGTSSPADMSWGRCYSASRHFDGDFAEGKLYNRALTEAEALQNFNGIRSRFGI